MTLTLIAIATAAGYALLCAVQPFAPCKRCTPAGCKRCAGRGRRLRTGRRAINSARRRHARITR